MTDDPIYHVDGDLVPASEATVSVDDRGFRYGDAAFETMRAYGGTIFAWDRHRERLERTCKALSLSHGLSDNDLRARIDETLAANDLADATCGCRLPVRSAGQTHATARGRSNRRHLRHTAPAWWPRGGTRLGRASNGAIS